MTRFAPFMDIALEEAVAASTRAETPVGAVVVGADGTIIARAGNRTRELLDPTAHAEMLVIRLACGVLGTERLRGCTLYVTLEPCAMCAAAIVSARLERLVYGAADPKSGGVEQGACVFAHAQAHHRPDVVAGVAEAKCAEILRVFFRARRDP